MRYAQRRDSNEPTIVDAARKIGLKVFYTNELGDLVVQFGGHTELWEVKTEKGTLTQTQCRMRQAGLKSVIIRSVDDVLASRARFMRQTVKPE